MRGKGVRGMRGVGGGSSGDRRGWRGWEGECSSQLLCDILPILPLPASSSSHTVDVLFLVVDGGLYLEEPGDKDAKMIDYQTFVGLLHETSHQHFRGARQRLAFRHVPCPNFSSTTLQVLHALEPRLSSSPPGGLILSHYCMAVLPLVVAESSEYLAGLGTLVTTANGAYQEFVSSEEGRGFAGQVRGVA